MVCTQKPCSKHLFGLICASKYFSVTATFSVVNNNFFYYYYFTPSEFFTPALVGSLSLESE